VLGTLVASRWRNVPEFLTLVGIPFCMLPALVIYSFDTMHLVEEQRHDYRFKVSVKIQDIPVLYYLSTVKCTW
jgi:hypothetical protein